MSKVEIRRAQIGDERILAYIQTESWKSAFADIISAEEMVRCTDTEKTEEMYRKVLKASQVEMIIEYVGGKAHGISAWGKNRYELGNDIAELICIHSLPDNRYKGYGSIMMEYALGEMNKCGFTQVVLWVFEKNHVARKFYEKHGFTLTAQSKQIAGVDEVMYIKTL